MQEDGTVDIEYSLVWKNRAISCSFLQVLVAASSFYGNIGITIQ